MIDRTVLEIECLEEHHELELRHRYARRDRMRYIDGLIDAFELLNLADQRDVPHQLTGRVYDLVSGGEHPIRRCPLVEVPIAEWMDVLYDLQDPLMPNMQTAADDAE